MRVNRKQVLALGSIALVSAFASRASAAANPALNATTQVRPSSPPVIYPMMQSLQSRFAGIGVQGGDAQKTLADLTNKIRQECNRPDLSDDAQQLQFEIQTLMSDYNQAEQLLSSILKKKDDAGNAIIQKI